MRLYSQIVHYVIVKELLMYGVNDKIVKKKSIYRVYVSVRMSPEERLGLQVSFRIDRYSEKQRKAVSALEELAAGPRCFSTSFLATDYRGPFAQSDHLAEAMAILLFRSPTVLMSTCSFVLLAITRRFSMNSTKP